jgi:hypothetical protein
VGGVSVLPVVGLSLKIVMPREGSSSDYWEGKMRVIVDSLQRIRVELPKPRALRSTIGHCHDVSLQDRAASSFQYLKDAVEVGRAPGWIVDVAMRYANDHPSPRARQ